MYEVNDELDVKIAVDIGPQKKRAVVVDNFYKNPDEVRQLCLDSKKITPEDDPGMISSLPGNRVFIKTEEVAEKLEKVFFMLCFDPDLWEKPFDVEFFHAEWDKSGFMCNVINDSTLLRNPNGIIPHQDSYPSHINNLRAQFGAVIYLNTPEECAGGTNLYSFNGQMTLPDRGRTGIPKPENEDEMSQEDLYNHINNNLKESPEWTIEHKFEMVYNRLVLYEADVLHGQNVDLGMFTEYDRINQIFFM